MGIEKNSPPDDPVSFEIRRALSLMRDVPEGMEGQMRVVAFEVGRTIGIVPIAVASAYYYLASAGMDALQCMMMLPRVTTTARSANIDIKAAAELVTDCWAVIGKTCRAEDVPAMTIGGDSWNTMNDVRGYAIRCLAPLASLTKCQRRQVLEQAQKMSEV